MSIGETGLFFPSYRPSCGKRKDRGGRQERAASATSYAPITPSPGCGGGGGGGGGANARRRRKNKKKKGGGGGGDGGGATTTSTSIWADGRGGGASVSLSSDADLDDARRIVRRLLRKHGMEGHLDESIVLDVLAQHWASNSNAASASSATGARRVERAFLKEIACDCLRKLAGLNSKPVDVSVPRSAFDVVAVGGRDGEPSTAAGVLRDLFRVFERGGGEDYDDYNDGNYAGHHREGGGRGSLWTMLDDATTSPILEAALSPSSVESRRWFEEHASDALEAFSLTGMGVRQRDVTVLLGAGLRISCKSVAALFSSLPRGRGIPFNNRAAKLLSEKSTIVMKSQGDYKLVMDAVSDTVGKGGKVNVNFTLRQACAEMHKIKSRHRSLNVVAPSMSETREVPPTKEVLMVKKAQEEAEMKLVAQKLITHKITSALQWYNNLLDELNAKAAAVVARHGDALDDVETKDDNVIEKSTGASGILSLTKPTNFLSSDQVIDALNSCDTEELLAEVETGIDLLQWDGVSEWTIDITEQAHKFFQRHMKRERALCERVLRRLTLLSTGRWPYVLCKPLKSKHGQISLYETKIDAASRIIWEVAIAFSPRRSNLDENFAEQ